MTVWTVYIFRCADGTFYIGIAKDAARRIEKHNSSNLLAASYTCGRRPVVLVHQETARTYPAALKRAYEIKQMRRAEKKELIKCVPCTPEGGES